MEKTITVELITPEKSVFQAQADFVALPAWEGEMGVLPGHIPYLVQLKGGEVRLESGGQTKLLAISGGFADIGRDKISLFAETAEMAEQIDAERARQAAEKAKAALQRKDIDPLTLAQAEADLRQAQVRLKVAKQHKPSHSPQPHPDSNR